MFPFRRTLVVWLAIALICREALPQCHASDQARLPDFLLRSWNHDDGLPDGDVRAIVRTADGYLWLGTSHGLCRFDGVRFVTLTTTNTPGLEDDRVTSLLVARTGDLWVGTQGGIVARRRNGRFEPVPQVPASQGRAIDSLAEDAEGALWVAVRGKGAVRWRAGSWNYPGTNDSMTKAISQVVAGKDGSVWARSNGRVLAFTDGDWKPVGGFTTVLPGAVILAAAREGGIWVGTAAHKGSGLGTRVFKIDDQLHVVESAQSYPWRQNSFHTQIRALLEDTNRRLWVGMMGAGVRYLDPDTSWQTIDAGDAFAQVLVKCFCADNAGSLWVGYRGAHLDQLQPRTVRTLHLPRNARENVIRMVCARRDGSIWVGTDGAGVFSFQNGRWRNYSKDDGLLSEYIGLIFEDRHTNLWVGTWGGMYRLKGERFVTAIMAENLAFRAMLEDSHGDLWFGTSAGVLHLKGNQAIRVPGDQGYTGAEVLTLAEDANGSFWAGLNRRGLFQLMNDQFERCPADPWGGKAEIICLLPDDDGGLWLGSSSSGLAYLKNGKSRKWTVADGLPSNGIRAMELDSEGNLWCSSDNGIFGCSRNLLKSYERALNPPILFWHLTTRDGLDTSRCSGIGQPVAARSADGRLWFPNWRALAVFNPKSLPFGGHVRQPLLEETLVDGAPVVPTPEGIIRANSSARSYQFHYTSPNLRAPDRVQFRYWLKGVDPNWVEAGQRRVAYYSHLPPGHYQFSVMAGGSDGVWDDVPEDLQLTVVPQIWERRSVQGLGVLGLVLAVVGTVWRVARARMQRRLALLERQRTLDQERSRIARDMHDEIGARLTQISLLSALADGSAGDALEVRTQTQKISGVARSLTRSLDEIVWAVRPQNDNLESLVDYLDESLRDLCSDSPVRYWFAGPGVVPAIEVPANVRHNILLACSEVVNNALKHSGATEVRVNVRLVAQQLEIRIADNGRGFDLPEGEAKRSGLIHIRQRLNEICGNCAVQSTAGQGTQFVFTIPIDREASTAPVASTQK